MSDNVLVERRGAVAIVSLNLSHKRNALTAELVENLARTLDSLQDESGLRALVLSGGTHFCAGGDLGSLDAPALTMRRYMTVGHRIIRSLNQGPLPVVAAVQGNAYGAGFSMALACDFIVGDANTTFCAAFGRLGLVPDYGLMWSLPQRVGMGRARELFYLAEPITGQRAVDWGLIDRLADPGMVFDAAVELAGRLAAAPPGTIATTKAALSRAPLSLDVMLAWEADTQALMGQTNDLAEGVNAIREKRPPRFTGL
jgi:2-(1,2-epoxy-1,2-dihydrophenyl)acetyl-CoA isomerase